MVPLNRHVTCESLHVGTGGMQCCQEVWNVAKEQLALAQSKGFKNHSVGRLRGKKLKIKIPQWREQHQSPHRQVPACGTAARILVRSAPGVTTTSFTKHSEPDTAAKHSSLEHGITTAYNEKKKEQPPKEDLFSSLFSKVKEQPRGSPPPSLYCPKAIWFGLFLVQ